MFCLNLKAIENSSCYQYLLLEKNIDYVLNRDYGKLCTNEYFNALDSFKERKKKFPRKYKRHNSEVLAWHYYCLDDKEKRFKKTVIKELKIKYDHCMKIKNQK